ncbi:MAG: hypothetical protein RL266_1461 [Bacteroidota bacterium]|jgi:subtilisin-like proprotein convertase family protein
MKSMFTKFKAVFVAAVAVLTIVSWQVGVAQVATLYTFSQTAGTYTPITGGTVYLSGSFDDGLSAAITIPSFNYDGTAYTSLKINANGHIAFGTYTSTTNYTPLSSSTNATGGIVSAFGADLNNAAAGTPEIRYEQVGNEFVVQYQDVRRYNVTSERISFQIRLNTVTNVINVVYGGTITPGNSTSYPQVGLKGPNNTFATNINNRRIAAAGGSWINSVAGTNNSHIMYFRSTNAGTVPASGLTFTWTPASCFAPTGLTATSVTATSATVSWTAASPAPSNGYEWEVRTSGAGGSGATGLTTSGTVGAGVVTAPTGATLTAQTAYNLYVRSYCGGSDYSGWAGPYAFTTPCAAITTLPHTEPFATYLPSTCWSEGDAGTLLAGPTTVSATAASWGVDGFANSSGTGAAKYNIYTTGANDWLISPQFTIPASPAHHVKYDVAATQFAGTGAPTSAWEADDYVEVLISTSGMTNWTALTTYNSGNVPSNAGITEAWNLNAYAGQTVRFAFRVVEGASNGSADIDFFVDNFIVEAIPACTPASALALSPQSPTTADLSWTGAGNYIVEYGAVGFAPGTGASAGAGTIATSSATTPYTITFPTSTTIYDVYIRQVCPGPLYSSNVGPVKFVPGDVCANAIDLGSLTSPLSSTTAGAGSDYSLSCGTNTASDLVYSIDVPIGAQLTIGQTVNGYDSRNAMFYGGACPGSTQIACYDDPDDQTNTWTNTTGTPQTVYWVQDGYASGSGTFTLAWSLNLCGGTPSALGTASLGETTATISWTGATPTPGNGYQWEVRTSGTGGSGATGLVDNGTTTSAVTSANITGLTGNTTYFIWVRGDCGSGNYGVWAGPTSFTTTCAAASVPFFDGFESGQTSNATVVNCWLQESLVDAASVWTANTANTTYNRTPRTGSWNATLEYGNEDWLFYPLQFTGGTSYTIDFYARQDGSNTADATVSIAYGTVPAAAAMTLNVVVNQQGLTNGNYQLVQGAFTPPVTGVYFIGIRSTINANPWYVSIDDVNVYETPACVEPTVAAATNVTGTSASLNWAASPSAPANGYEWEVRTSGVGGSGATGLVANGSVAAGVLTATTGSGLTNGTTYQVYVRAFCGTANYSAWNGPVAFTTAYANPYCSNGGVAIPDAGAPSSCAEVSVAISGLSGNNLGTNVFLEQARIQIQHTYDADVDAYLVSPTGTQIELSTDNGGGGDNYGTFPISCPISSGYTAFQTGAPAITGGAAPYVGTYAPEGLFSAFNGQDPNGTWKLKVCDDLGGDIGTVHYFGLSFATCMPPTITAPTALTSTSATLTWTAASPAPGSGYEWEVRTSGAGGSGATGLEAFGNVGAGVLTAGTGSTLSQATTYYVYVRSNCGSGDYSAWAGPYTLITPCDPATVPFFDGFEADQTNATAVAGCWTQSSVTGAEVWTANNSLTSYNRTPRTGSYNAYLAYSNEDWMFYPITLTGGQSYTAEVFARQDGATSTNASVTLKFGTAPIAAGMTLNVAGANAVGIVNGGYQLVQGTFTPGTTQTYYLGVKGTINGTPWYISIDDVSVYETPSCLPPTSISATNIVGTTADLTWAASVSLPADGYEWELRTSGAGGSGATGLVASGSVGAGVLTASTGPVLSANTVYSVYVRSVCAAATTFSTWGSGTFSSVPNDLCANATDLPCGTTGLAGSTVNTVNEPVVVGCGMSGYGVWYKFAGDGQIATVSATTAGFDVEMAIASGSCGSGNLTNIACRDVAGATGTETYTFTTAIGTDYYVYIGSYVSGGAGTGSFTISRTCAPAPVPPANDACANAVNLNCLNTVNGTTVNAVSESTVGFGCTTSSYGVWYKFTGDGNQTTISCDAGAGFDHELTIVSGSCGTFTNIACVDDGLSGDVETYAFNTTNGTDYYVYVSHYSSFGDDTDVGTFSISRTCAPPPPVPVNDLCSGALNLDCGTTLSGTTVGSVSETGLSCGMSIYNVWYSFEGNGFPVTISCTAEAGFDHEIGIASGVCGSLTNIACRDIAFSGGTETYTLATTTVGTTYYVYVGDWETGSTVTGSFTITRTCPGLSVWTGVTSGDWATASNWEPASVPLATGNAYIPGDPIGGYWPVIDEAAAIANITVESGALFEVLSGFSLSVTGALVNHGTFDVRSGGSLYQATGSTVAGSGVFNIKRDGSEMYDFWSSPVTTTPASALPGAYQYNPATGTADPSDDEFDPGWVTATGNLTVARGYAAHGVLQKTFSGMVNNGNLTVGVTSHALPNVSWNLIGNPYPSGVTVSQFLSTNSAILNVGAVYLWDDPGTGQYGTGDYAVRNSAGGTAGGGGNTPTGVLGSAQGFKVQVNGNGNISFNNAMRTAGNTSMLFRQAESKRLWLQATGPEGLYNQTLVGFFEDGSDGLDWAYDAPKLNWMSALSLYSLIDGEPYAIQGYGPFYEERVVPLGMHIADPVAVTISLEDLDGMEDDNIYLEDAYLGIFHDLQAGGYDFVGTPGLYQDRFYLHFLPMSVTGIDDVTSSITFGAFIHGEILNVYSKDDLQGTLEVLDLSGRIVYSEQKVQLNQTGVKVDVSTISNGVYIVRFVGSDSTLSKKVLK